MMKKYIGFKLIQAEPMNKYEFQMNIQGIDCFEENQDGYKVVYPDGYTSWSPKEVFEKSYMEIGDNYSITQDMVDGFIEKTRVTTIGDKTTIVFCTLINGFELSETSACVDPINYDEKVGAEICIGKIKDKIWYLLGFLLQTARYGIKL